MARPSTYTPEIAAEICARLMEGQSLRKICADTKMPGVRTVYTWLSEDVEFQQQYARAREVQADTLADEIIYLADTTRLGTKVTTKVTGETETVQVDMVERSRLQIESRKWLAGKLRPKKYGERVEQRLTGPDGGPIQLKKVNDLTDEELLALATGSGQGAADPQAVED